MAKSIKKTFSKKSRTVRRKKMGGKRQNKSSKTHHKKGMKKMWGGAPVTSGVVESADGQTLTIEWGTYPNGQGPTLSSPVYGDQSLDLPSYSLDGSEYNSIIQNVPEKSEWMLNYGGKTYKLKMLRYEAPKPTEGRMNGQFVFDILPNSDGIEDKMGKLTIQPK
jgi:hypothetical protein